MTDSVVRPGDAGKLGGTRTALSAPRALKWAAWGAVAVVLVLTVLPAVAVLVTGGIPWQPRHGVPQQVR